MLQLADKAAARRLPGRDPRDRRCRQCADHLASTSSCRRNMAGDRRWRIEHFQIVDPADIPRLAPAGIIASMQPTHQTSDRLMAEARLGPEPARRRLCLADGAEERRAARVRVRLPGRNRPTPSPASPPAISRQDMNGQPPGGWIPAERLTLRAGARRLHARRGLCRLRRGQDRRARARQMGRLHPGRPRSDQGRPAGAGADAGSGDLGRRKEGVGSARLALRATERGK